MDTGNQKTSAQAIDQIFKFFISVDSAVRTTVTIHAENLDSAWNRLHVLFPGADLSNTEVQHATDHSPGERDVHK